MYRKTIKTLYKDNLKKGKYKAAIYLEVTYCTGYASTVSTICSASFTPI